jgi:hypothetical protein
MTRDNATSRTRGNAGCMVVVITSTETAARDVGPPPACWASAPAPGWSLAGGMSGLQWVVDGYTLMFAALLLSAGRWRPGQACPRWAPGSRSCR